MSLVNPDVRRKTVVSLDRYFWGSMIIPMVTTPLQKQLKTPEAKVSAKVAHSRRVVREFIEYQQKWLQHGKEAAGKGFPVETIGICLNQIHAILRKGLWLQAQNQSLEQHPDVWKDSYLFDLLQTSQHDLMENAPDRGLYNAAQRFKVIDQETATTLHMLYSRSAGTLRDVFSHAGARPDLGSIAGEAMQATEACLQRLAAEFAEFDRRIDALLQRLENA